MNSYLVQSIDRMGATISTRHFMPLAVETEKLRRLLSGHTGIVVQEEPWTNDQKGTCLRRKREGQRRPGQAAGGQHV